MGTLRFVAVEHSLFCHQLHLLQRRRVPNAATASKLLVHLTNGAWAMCPQHSQNSQFRLGRLSYTSSSHRYSEWYPKGISYTGGARVLTSLRSRAKFREVRIGDEQVSLYFVLKGLPSKVAAGNGISRTWHGFSSTMMHEGRLILDAKRLTPISIEYGGTSERYSDYVEVRPSCYVPLSICIGKPGTQYRWTFRVYKPGLWLFDKSHIQDSSDSREPIASVSNVNVNGRPGERMPSLDE